MSTDRPKSKRDPRQMRLGFEPTRPDGSRWCTKCKQWVREELFDLFHAFGHPVRPYDVQPPPDVDSSK